MVDRQAAGLDRLVAGTAGKRRVGNMRVGRWWQVGRLVAEDAVLLLGAGHAGGQVGDAAMAVQTALIVQRRVWLRDRRTGLGDLVAVRALLLGDALVAWCDPAQALVGVAGHAAS